MKKLVKRIAPPKKAYMSKKISQNFKKLLKPYGIKVPK
jgi:hypothetical protein